MPGPMLGWQTERPMGQHADAAGGAQPLRRTAQICGLVGGGAWVAGYVLGADGGLATALLWGGAALLTIALFATGMRMVKGDVLVLRVFVALALPTLVWGVFALVRDSLNDDALLDAVFGGAVALLCLVALARRSDRARRATL